MSITMEASRCQRQMRNLQSKLKSQKMFQDNALSSQYQTAMQTLYAGLEKDASGNLTAKGQKQYQDMQSSIFSQQQQYQSQKAYAEQMFETLYESQLEPLKLKEERLETEKAQAETNLQFWTQTEQAYTSATKEGVKGVIPDVSG